MAREYSVVGSKASKGCPLWLTVCLAVLAVLFLAAFIAMLVLFLQKEEPKAAPVAPKGQNICFTKDCVDTASSIINAMNPDVKPCEDFYEFACGTYIKKHPVPDDAREVSVHKDFETLYKRQLRDLIEGDFSHGTSRVLLRAQEAYHVCLNTSYQPEREFRAFRNFVNNKLGGWPFALGENWKPRESLEDFLANIQLLGFGAPFGVFAVEPDAYNPNRTIISFRPIGSESAASRSRSSALNSREKEEQANARAYLKLLKDVASSLGKSGSQGNIDDILKMLSFESSIEKVNEAALSEDEDDDDEEDSEKEGEEDDGEYEYLEESEDEEKDDGEEEEERSETMTMKEMNELANGTVDWLQVLNIMFKGIHNFTEDDWILADKAYVTALSEVLAKTERRTIADFVVWKVIYQILKHGSPQIEKLFDDFLTSLDPDTYRKPFRWDLCAEWIQTVYPFAMTRFFVDKYVSRQRKTAVEEMITLVHKAYKKIIRKSDWLDKKTKRNAIKKANHMKTFVGYPDFLFDDTKLESFYSYIPTVKGVHFNNVIDAKRNFTRTSLMEYVKFSVYKWDFNPLEINAFYAAWTNSLWFPIGILQLPYFHENRPAAVNFGMTGATIGHEIGHGFDDSGKDFDEIGRWRDWWTEDTAAKYKNLTECYIEQYNNYCPEELHGSDSEEAVCVDGEQTLGENIADNTGLRAAFEAYRMWVHKHGKELRLPGLQEYSPNQIFFISFAYSWCQNIPIENWLMVYGDDEHSPAKYRVIGSLSNSPEFAEAFKCPKGMMNMGEERCRVW